MEYFSDVVPEHLIRLLTRVLLYYDVVSQHFRKIAVRTRTNLAGP